jgi:hypothetical protein
MRLEETGETPPGVDPRHHHVRSAAAVLPPERSFADACRDALTVRPGVKQTSV